MLSDSFIYKSFCFGDLEVFTELSSIGMIFFFFFIGMILYPQGKLCHIIISDLGSVNGPDPSCLWAILFFIQISLKSGFNFHSIIRYPVDNVWNIVKSVDCILKQEYFLFTIWDTVY